MKNQDQNILIKNTSGYPVNLVGTSDEDITPTDDVIFEPGFLYVSAACTAVIKFINSATAKSYIFPEAGVYPFFINQINSTGTDAGIDYRVIR